MKQYFAERNGFVKPSNILVTGRLNDSVINAISSCISNLARNLNREDERVDRANGWLPYDNFSYYQLSLSVWSVFFNKRVNDYGFIEESDDEAMQRHLLSISIPWYTKLGMLEYAIVYMEEHFKDKERIDIKNQFISELNSSFERTGFGYRIINGIITDIVSKSEINTIEHVLDYPQDTVRNHMNQALVLYSQRPEPDYRNSVKEAISAVEALFREITGENTFGPSFTKIKK